MEDLKNVQRPKVVEAIAEARSHGDLKENAEYHAAKERQALIESRVIAINDLIARANVIDVTKIDNDVEDRLNQTQDELNNIKKEIRRNEIKLNPFYSWINDNYVNIQEKEMLFDSIINEIKYWRTATFVANNRN